MKIALPLATAVAPELKLPRHRRLGFTLIEMMVAVMVSSVVILAGMTFAQQQIRAYSKSEKIMELNQAGRASLDLLVRDLSNAGSGLGHHESGQFIGLDIGAFEPYWIPPGGAVPSTALFSTNNKWESSWGNVTDADTNPSKLMPTQTDDIGLLMADGEWVTIVAETTPGAAITVCAPSSVKNQDRVVMHTADGREAASFQVNPTAAAGTAIAQTTCPTGVTCQATASNQCENWAITPVAAGNPFFFESGPGATSALYDTGWAAGGLRRVVWFVNPNGSNYRSGRLMRLINETCPSGRATNCGQMVADNVETVQMRAYRWTATGWTPIVNPADRDRNCRIKVDVEMVVRGRAQDETGKEGMDLVLHTKNWVADDVVRKVYRTSVEIKNSGRMLYKPGGGC